MHLSMRVCITMRTTKGFTIIEMVIVMVIASVIMVASSYLMVQGFDTYFAGVNLSSLNTQANMAMTRMSKELQEAISFSSISATSVAFTTTTGHTITYTYSGTTLTRKDQQGLNTAQTLATSVSGLTFYYYDYTFTTTAVLTSIQAVTISMTFNNSNQIIPMINTIYFYNT